MEGTLHIVDAVAEEHFRAMSRIHALGWRDTYVDALPADYLSAIGDDHWLEAFRQNFLTDNGCKGILLYRGDTPVCCLNYCPARTSNFNTGEVQGFDNRGYEDYGEIASFYTHPDERGKGYGGILFEAALERLRRDGFRRAFVFVLRENGAARRFYAAHGFAWDGTSIDIPFPHDTICVDLRYVRTL